MSGGKLLERIQRHPTTGATRRLTSADDGKTWQLSDDDSDVIASDQKLDAAIDAQGPEDRGGAVNPGFEPAEEEPGPPAVQATAVPAQQPAREPEESMWDSLTGGFHRATGGMYQNVGERIPDALDTLADAGRGFGQGATFRLNDELAPLLTPEVDDGTGIPREYAAGSAQADQRAQMRRENAEAKARSPWAYGGGEAAGMASTTSLALATPGVAPYVTAAGPIRAGAGIGIATGITSGAGGSDTDDPLMTLADANEGGIVGGVTGAALPAMGEGVRALARPAKELARSGADVARSRAMGFVGQGAKNRAKDMGLSSAPRNVAEQGERLLRPNGGAMSAEDYAEAAARVNSKSGQEIGDVVSQATQQIDEVIAGGGAVPKSRLLRSLGGMRAQSAAEVTDQGQSNARTLERVMQRIDQGYDDLLSPQDLHTIKYDLSKVGWPTAADKPTPTGQRQLTNQAASAPARRMLDETIEGFTPELSDRFRGANEDFGFSSMIKDLAGEQASRDVASRQGMGLLGWRSLVPQSVSDKMPDATANALRSVQSGIGSVERGAGAFAESSAAMSPVPAVAAGDALDELAGQRGSSPGEAAPRGVGSMLPAVAMRELQRDPQALGPYGQKLLDAQKDGSGAVAAAMVRLQNDPAFRRDYLPRLQSLTAESP